MTDHIVAHATSSTRAEERHDETTALTSNREDISGDTTTSSGVEHRHDTSVDHAMDLNDQGNTSTSSPQSIQSGKPTSVRLQGTRWQPVTLYRSYLLALTFLSIMLAIICFVLVAYSHTHGGLSNAGSSGGYKFSLKFVPTLFAVFYSLLWAPLVKDVIRIEPYALLSSKNGARAEHSLLRGDEMWWTHLADAVRYRKSHGIRWVVIIAVISGLIASVIINPLSAGLFDTVNLLSTQSQDFATIDTSAAGNSNPRISDATYLRAITNLLFNVSASAWSTEEIVVAPFWPSKDKTLPNQALLSSTPQQWQGNTEVYSTRLVCEPFTTVEASTEKYGSTPYTGLPFLKTNGGCGVILGFNYNWCNGAVWDNINITTSQLTFDSCASQGMSQYLAICSVNSSNLALQHTYTDSTARYTYYLSGQACRTEFLSAKIPVNVTTTTSGSIVSVDEEAFKKAQKPVAQSQVNTAGFEEAFVRQSGSSHLQFDRGTAFNFTYGVPNSNFMGPMLVVGAKYNYSLNAMLDTEPSQLSKQAQTVRQRFFSEVMLDHFEEVSSSASRRDMKATIVMQNYRLIAELGVGIGLGILFLLLAGAAVALFFLAGFRREPLECVHDPNKPSTAALALNESDAAQHYRNTDRQLATGLDTALLNKVFMLRDGKLLYVDEHVRTSPARTKPRKPSRGWSRPFKRTPKQNKTDWRSFTLRLGNGLLLIIFLVLLIAALVTVFAISRKRPLYQSAFVYDPEVNIAGTVLEVAPYSIIPTLIAVGVKLWWTTIEDAYRRLTPFLHMASAKSPPRASNGAILSYITTPILWVVAVAARKGHWLLAFITFGAFTAEVLQITMSALWTRQPGSITVDMTLPRQLQLRSVPHVFEDAAPLYRYASSVSFPRIAQYLYGGSLYSTSWEFGGLAQLSYGALPQIWSKDGWSVPPVDLSGVENNMPKLPNDDSPPDKAILYSALNVTFDSEAVRARLVCTPIIDSGRWIVDVNISALSQLSDYTFAEIPTGLQSGYELSSAVRVVDMPVPQSEKPDNITIGQWLHYDYSLDLDKGTPLYDPFRSKNFTILWINAKYPYRLNYKTPQSSDAFFGRPARLIFAEKPQVQALNCEPIIETATARVTANAKSAQIVDIKLLDKPQPVKDAWDDAFVRHFIDENYYYSSKSIPDLNDVLRYNITVSWGYLFQLALLQACNTYGVVNSQGDRVTNGVPGKTPFSFLEPDSYFDPYSYSALSLAKNDQSTLLDAATLTKLSQQVYSTFFQRFVSTKSNYKGDHWAYQALDEALPQGLDFGPVESFVTRVSTGTWTYCQYQTLSETETRIHTLEIDVSGSTQPSIWTETRTYAPVTCISDLPSITSTTTTSAIYRTISNTRSSATSSSDSLATTTPSASLQRRADSTDPRRIKATLSVQTEMLVISTAALFLSVAILLFLIVTTIVVFFFQGHHLRALPRDFDSPASIMAAVYASEKFKAWSQRQHERSLGASQGSKSRWRSKPPLDEAEDVHVGMGYFVGADGEEHWGVEVAGNDATALQAETTEEDESSSNSGVQTA